VTVKDTVVEGGLRDHGAGLEDQPNVAFYSPIVISEPFALTTLVSALKDKGKVASPPTVVKPTHADWAKHAVSRFLQGRYLSNVHLGATATADEVVLHAMPTVVMSTTGQVTLMIVLARSALPQDGDAKLLDALAPGVDPADAAHPINARIPARHVYRVLRAHLLGGAAGSAIPDRTLAVWPAARRYFPFRITRTWENIPNFSVLFPSRTALVSTVPGTSITLPVPAHGVVYIPQDPGSGTPPAVPTLSLTGFTGGLTTFLAGATPQAWNAKSGTTAVPLSTTTTSHVILRRPLREEILADPVYPRPGGMLCTYLSLRRSTRAFVDHRVTGGRLAREGARTKKPTLDLMANAWVANPGADPVVRDALALAPRLLRNANPPATAGSGGKARDLEKIWIVFFPNDVPPHDVDNNGVLTRSVIYKGGQMFYALWQTIESVLAGNGTKRNFSNEHVGCGAPGAIVAIGLSPGFLTRPPHAGASPTPAELDTNVNELLTRLTPAAALQLWRQRDDYRLERSRVLGITSYGHSPLFEKYMPLVGGVPSGIVVVDQFGNNQSCPVVGGRIAWHSDPEDVWIAAQWDD
jgi:hypothetical protein